MRVLSGVQPTGELHLGNYLGAIRNWVDLQQEYDTFFCVVDLHAITVAHEPKKLLEATRSSAAVYIAAGIDPEKATIFVQSHVTAHAELTWLLNCSTPIGWLEKMIQYKEKARKQGENVSVGLLDYPVLMAADILLYGAELIIMKHVYEGCWNRTTIRIA
jgi:tryptophanyl-tRNA synthetase